MAGSMKDLGRGAYRVEVVHEWVTSTAPEHGLTNVTVLLDGRHVVNSDTDTLDHTYTLDHTPSTLNMPPRLGPKP
jgi:hypothetical protein